MGGAQQRRLEIMKYTTRFKIEGMNVEVDLPAYLLESCTQRFGLDLGLAR